MKRVLFFPSCFGNGFGHVARCLAVAEEMSCRGWAVGMVLAGMHAKPVQEAGYKVFKPFFPKPRRSNHNRQADYAYIVDSNMQVLRDGFVRPWRVSIALAEVVHAVKVFRPDVLVGDMSLLTWLAGQKTGIPVVQILQGIVHPASQGVIWWEDTPAGIQSPDIRPVFAPVLKKMGLPDISRAEELLQGDCYLIPGIPEVDPLPVKTSNTHYIGPLLYHPSHNGKKIPSLLDMPLQKPVIYVTHGGGRGADYDCRFFNLINKALGDMPWTVIYSTGRTISPGDLPPAASNIVCYQWLPNSEVLQKSDVVIFHGGYTTMMETVFHGVPSVVIPSQSEQEGNGRRLKALSAASVLQPAPTQLSQLVEGRWPYGKFTNMIKKDCLVEPDSVRTAVESMIKDANYRKAAQDLSAKAKKYQGAVDAVGLIESMLR